MAWDNAIVTNAGILLLQRVLAGEQLALDNAAGGADTVPAETLPTQTALVNQRQTFPIVTSMNVSNGKKVGIQITNVNLSTDYTMKQVGIWAHVGTDASILFAILQDSTGVPIPSEASLPDFLLNFYAVIDFSNSATFTITIDPSTLVTMGVLNTALAGKVDKTNGTATGLSVDMLTADVVNFKSSINGVSIQADTTNASNPSLILAGLQGDENVRLEGVANPSAPTDAANKAYVDAMNLLMYTQIEKRSNQAGTLRIHLNGLSAYANDTTLSLRVYRQVRGRGTRAIWQPVTGFGYANLDGKHFKFDESENEYSAPPFWMPNGGVMVDTYSVYDTSGALKSYVDIPLVEMMLPLCKPISAGDEFSELILYGLSKTGKNSHPFKFHIFRGNELLAPCINTVFIGASCAALQLGRLNTEIADYTSITRERFYARVT
jgi:hypothetical protein